MTKKVKTTNFSEQSSLLENNYKKSRAKIIFSQGLKTDQYSNDGYAIT